MLGSHGDLDPCHPLHPSPKSPKFHLLKGEPALGLQYTSFGTQKPYSQQPHPAENLQNLLTSSVWAWVPYVEGKHHSGANGEKI